MRFVEVKKYIQPLLKISVPIMISNIINQVQMLIDRAFLGHVDNHYMSAITNVSTPVWTSMSFCFSLTIGASIIISQKIGQKDKNTALAYAASLMKWNNILPVCLFAVWMFFSPEIFKYMGVSEKVMPMCLEYVRCIAPVFLVVGLEGSTMVIMQTSNYTKPLLIFGIVRSAANVVLDWIMIFGRFGFPAMGIKGAAIATLISEYIGILLSFIIFFSSNKLYTRPSVKEMIAAPFFPFFKSCKLGINTAAEDFLWNFGNIILITILNSIDDMAAGIYTIVFSVELLVIVIIGALGSGTLTLSSEATGKKDHEQFMGVCICAFLICVIITFVTLLLCALFPDYILGIFTADKEVIGQCRLYLILVCVNLFFKVFNIIFGSSIRASGNTIWMFMSQIFGTVFVISLAWIFVKILNMGIAGVILAIILDECTRGIINMLKCLQIAKKAG